MSTSCTVSNSGTAQEVFLILKHYVVGFYYPGVPRGRDRIRVQISAGPAEEDLDFAVSCFKEVQQEIGI